MRRARLFSALVVCSPWPRSRSPPRSVPTRALSLRHPLAPYGAWRRPPCCSSPGPSRPGRQRRLALSCAPSRRREALTALYGIAQYFGWDPILPAAAYHIGEGIWTIVRPPGTLGYVSYFATWLLFVVFLSLALAALEESRSWREHRLRRRGRWH